MVQHMTVYGTHPGAFSRESISESARNGFFTGSLKTRLRSQGKTTDVRQLLGSVRDDVLEATGGRQQPYIAGSLHGDLCLVIPGDELEPVRVPPLIVSACRAFIAPIFSLQIAAGFLASIETGNLEALLHHLSSGESPSKVFVGDEKCIAFLVFFSPTCMESSRVCSFDHSQTIVRIVYMFWQCLQANGWTPLRLASECGQLECIKALIGRGANVNQALVRLASPYIGRGGLP
jgi:hypothetical protein